MRKKSSKSAELWPFGKAQNPLHEELKQQIKKNPALIGLEGVIIGVREEVECRNGDGFIACVPDLIFLCPHEQVIVEIKSSSHPNALKKLEDQLKRNYSYFRDYRNKRCRCIGVYLNKKGEIQYYALY